MDIDTKTKKNSDKKRSQKSTSAPSSRSTRKNKSTAGAKSHKNGRSTGGAKSHKNGRSGASRRRVYSDGSKRNRKHSWLNDANFDPNADVVIGRIEGNPSGFAFLIRDDREKDIFISPSSLNGAIDGDKVAVIVRQKLDGGAEGYVTEILQPTTRQFIGTFVARLDGKAYVIPDNKKLPYDVSIEDKHSLDAQNSDKVLFSIISRKAGLSGKVVRIFKESDNIDWDVFLVLLDHNIKDEFSEQSLRESERISETLLEEDLISRHDFTDTLAITIDGEDSRDFDDAVSLSKIPKGYELTVHIADVSHYVRAGSALDKEAFTRGTSVYFPGSFVPMLPEKICNNVCSLMENRDRLTLSVIMHINPKGNVIKHKITNGVIRSARRMTYNQVENILNGDEKTINKYSEIVPMLSDMRELALILNKRRTERGSVDFDLPECQVILDKDGGVKDVRRAPRLTSHRIIEEFMLITNETVAEHMNKEGAPFVYRGHLPPNDLKLDSFTDFLAAIGVKWDRSESVVPMDYSKLLSNIPENLSNIVNMMALRSMTKAAYFPINKGHFGLASEFYCHFTAPIRRYPDLIIHRIIKDYLKNGKKCFQKYTEFTIEASNQSSLTERVADEAERDVEDIYKARFMGTKIGEEFDGIISGVTEWGVYVQLENTIEGLVKKESLPGGNYSFNPIVMSLSNMTRIFRPGDPLRIKVLSVSRNKIDFTLAEN